MKKHIIQVEEVEEIYPLPSKAERWAWVCILIIIAIALFMLAITAP